MTKKNLFKKIASVALAGALTLSMALPVGAATEDPNLVVEPNTKYSTQIEAGKSVTLGLMPANAHYQRTGFDSKDDAANALKVESITVGKDKISTDALKYGAMQTDDGSWAGTVQITGKDGAYGPASLHIVNTKSTSSTANIDMTVYVEAATTQNDVTVASVEATDLTDGGSTYEYGENLTVAAADKNVNNPFKDADGSAQSYPTAGDALYSLAETNGLSFVQEDGYVQSLTDSNGTLVSCYTTEDWTYYGWNYWVIRNGEKVAEGDIVSASVVEVKNTDKVYWAFGTSKQAEEYFDMLAAAA